MRPLLIAFLSLIAASCASAPPPAAKPAEVATPRTATFDLRDAVLTDILRAASAAAGKPVVITPEAQPVARCARATLLAPSPVAIDHIEPLIAATVASASLSLEVTADGWVIRRGTGPVPPSCEPRRPEPPATDQDRAPAQVDMEAIRAGIRSLDDQRFEVRRSVFDSILENQAALMRDARIVPDRTGGTVTGVRLFRIRPGGILDALGLRNGDRIRRVGGMDITSPDRALEAYAKVRNAEVIEVEVVRRGQDLTLVYRIVSD